jgi:hypothetical protein
MVDDKLQDAESPPDSAKPRRAPPTIDLDASEMSAKTRPAVESPAQNEHQDEHEDEETAPAAASSPVSPWVIAPFSGAAAAALVILVGWMLGWPQVAPPSAAPQVNAAAIDGLANRIANLESKAGKTDPTIVARLDSVEKSLAALRSELEATRAQSEKLGSAVNELKSAPQGSAPAAVDLSAINERIAQLERVASAQSAEIAGEKAAIPKPLDDTPLRRVVAAALLDVAVRHGDPYGAALSAAKSLAAEPDALKPLEPFADKGVPTPQLLNRELLALVPKLSATTQDSATSGTSIVDRLQAGAAKLVRVERTDATGNDRSAIMARVTAAALRNDFAEARRELASLSPADRAVAQGWLDRAAARDAALAASRQFAEEAMASLAKAAQ